jgi:hypothetical protein
MSTGVPAATLHFTVHYAAFHADDVVKAPTAQLPSKVVVHGRANV